jgi:hypothetical protein
VPLLVLEDETDQVPDSVSGGGFLGDLPLGLEERPFTRAMRLQQLQDVVLEVAIRGTTQIGGRHDVSPLLPEWRG